MVHRDACYIIIGASGGMGSALARSLTAQGAKLYLGARDSSRLEAFASELGQPWATLNACNPDSMGKFIDEAHASLGRIDGIVNLAGSILLKPAHQTSELEFQSVIDQNLTSAFLTIKYVVPFVSDSGMSILLFSSSAALIGLANHEAIAAAKAAVIGLTLSAAATYAGKNIRVNCIAPGLVRTQMSSRITSNPAGEKASLALHPLKRLGEPADIVPMASLLLSQESSWITGQVIGIDGGLSSLKGAA